VKGDFAGAQGAIEDAAQRGIDRDIMDAEGRKRRQFLAEKQGTDGMMQFFTTSPSL
jgi:hypothetical protein